MLASFYLRIQIETVNLAAVSTVEEQGHRVEEAKLSSGNCQLIRGDSSITLKQGTKTFFFFGQNSVLLAQSIREQPHTEGLEL